MRPEEEIDEDALSYGYVRADLEHRLRIWDPGPPAPVYLEVLPEGTRPPGSGPDRRRGTPPWASR